MNSNRINSAINIIGSEIINTLQDISSPIIDNINANTQKVSNQYFYHETDDYIYICVELPGVAKEYCNIEICGGYLNVKAKTDYQITTINEISEKEFDFIVNRNIEKKIDLKLNNIDESKVTSCFINGILKIKLKKKPKTNININ